MNSTTGFAVGQLSVSGGVNGEMVTLTTGSGTTSSANAGTYAGASLSGLAISVTNGNALASNYSLPATGTLTVNPEPVTITAATNTKTYDGTTTAAAAPTVTGTLYSIDGATLSESYATANAGTGLTLNPSASFGGANGGNNYTVTYVANTTGVINPAALTVSGAKVYDSTTGFAVGQLSVSGGVNGEMVTLTTGSGTTSSANAGTYAGASLSGLAISVTNGNALASNYSLPATGTLTVNPEPVTITAATNTKTYDGTTTAAAAPTVTGTLYSIDGATLSESYATANAGTGLTLNPSASFGGANGGNNYTVTYVANTTGVINPAALTVSGAKVYDSTTGFAVGQLSVSGGVNGEMVTLTTGSGTTSSANAGTYAGASLSGLAISVTNGNALASNYSLPATGTLTVNPEPVTITAATNTKTYDGTTTAAAAPTVTGTLYSIDGATLSGSYATANAGTGLTLNPSASFGGANGGNNYTVTYVANTTGVINPAALTVSGAKVYDSTTGFAVGQLSVSGGVNGEMVTLTTGSGTTSSANAGTYAGASLSGLAQGDQRQCTASNYSLPATGTLTVNPEPVTITAATNTKTYDGTTTAAAAPTVTGTLYSIDGATLSESYATANAGTGLTLNPSASFGGANGGNNYTVTYVANTTGVINPAALTVSGAKVYDSTTGFAVGQLSVSGGVNGEMVTLTTGSGTTSSANAGTYAGASLSGLAISVTNGNALASNYSLPATGTLTVNPEPVTITAATNTKTYDGTTTAAAAPTVTGTLYSIDGATLSESYATANAGTGLTLNPSASFGGANGGNNYTVTYVANTTGVINPAALTVSGAKVYDSTTGFAVGQLSVSGGVNGEMVTLTTGSGTTSSANAGTYAGASLSGLAISVTNGNALASNYSLPATGTLTVNPEPVTITAATNTKTYDGTTTAAAAPTVTGTLYSIDGATLSESYATANAGTGLTLNPSASFGGANGGNNYTVTYVANTTGVINPAALTVSGAKVYDSTTGFAVGQLSVSGGVNGEMVTLTTGSGTTSSANAGTYAGASLSGLAISVTNGNALASNYSLPATGTLTVNPEPVTITAATNTKTYDGTTTAAAAPTVTGTLYSIDGATLSESYATANAGTGLTLNPSASFGGANGGNNYTVTYVANTTGVINPAALTVSGAKVYDSTTGFAVGQLSVSGGVNGEMVTLTTGSGTTSSANAGTYAGASLSGLAISVTNGNALASNYSLPATGTLTVNPEPVTITAATNTKTYDGTTTAAAAPTVTGTLYSIDGATLSESYATANAGTGLTLNPSASFGGANGGNNYTVTYVANTTGVINPAALTVSGAKVYQLDHRLCGRPALGERRGQRRDGDADHGQRHDIERQCRDLCRRVAVGSCDQRDQRQCTGLELQPAGDRDADRQSRAGDDHGGDQHQDL